MSWTVKWWLRDRALPDEVERIRALIPDYSDDELLRAAGSHERFHDKRDQAEFHVECLLMRADTVERVELYKTDRHKKHASPQRAGEWLLPDPHLTTMKKWKPIHTHYGEHRIKRTPGMTAAEAMKAEEELRERNRAENRDHYVSGITSTGNLYHQLGQYLVQVNHLGHWHGYFRTLSREYFGEDMDAAIRWLLGCPPPHRQTDFRPMHEREADPNIPNCGKGMTHAYQPYNEAYDLCRHCGHVATKKERAAYELTLNSTPTIESMKFASDEEEQADAGSSPATALAAPVSELLECFTFRGYQREDIARAAMQDGAIIAWDPGMGKTMALFTFFMVKRARRVLIVAPAGLHDQIAQEGWKFFGVKVRTLEDQDAALRYMQEGILPMPGVDESEKPLPDKPEYFITAYNWLGYNGGDEWQTGEDEANDMIRRRRFVVAARFAKLSAPSLDALKKSRQAPHEILGVSKHAGRDAIEKAWREATRLNDPALHPGDKDMPNRSTRINDAFRKLFQMEGDEHNEAFTAKLAEVRKSVEHLELIRTLRQFEEGIGHEALPGSLSEGGVCKEDVPIRCCFKPTLCSLVKGLFDGVVCDEAVRLKSGTAYQAEGVLRMEAKYRLALTGTPIKNKLPDLFFLASFVTGCKEKAHARWPYGNRTTDRAQFAQDFGVWEENETKQEEARRSGKGIPRGKTDPTRICNIHRLWRVISTVLIRRRKDDVPGTDIVGKTIVPVRVMPGTEQQKVYGFQLDNPPPHKTDLAELGHQLQCLRMSALYPASKSLYRGPEQPMAISTQHFTPKSAGIMQLAIDLMIQGEQLVVFSPFQDFASNLAERFREAGIPHLNLDGNTNASKRGLMIRRFKSGEIPILLAGIESMGEGHSLDCCSHLVLPSLSWAFDKNAQAVERVHRLTSKKDVTIFVMVTKNTIDEKLVQLWQEKGDANDLALDGRLVETDKEEIDLGQLLRDAVKDFDANAATMDESEVEEQWALTLVPAMREAFQVYRELRPFDPDIETATVAKVVAAKPKPVTITARPITVTPAPAERPTPTTPNQPIRLSDLMRNLPRRGEQPPAPTPSPEAPAPAAAAATPLPEPPKRRSLMDMLAIVHVDDHGTRQVFPPLAQAEPEPDTAPPPPALEKESVIEIGKVIPFPGRLGKLLEGRPKQNPVVVPACLR